MNSANNSRPSAFTSRSTTLFTANVNNSVASGVGIVIDPNFISLISELLIFLNYYAAGDFKSIKENLTSATYINMSSALGRLMISDPNVELLQSSAMNSLQGLQRAYVQYNQLTDATHSYDVVKERAAILDDMVLLRAFLAELNTKSSTGIFGEQKIASAVPAMIPPEYLSYIQTYGFPPDGVFDVAKLASVS